MSDPVNRGREPANPHLTPLDWVGLAACAVLLFIFGAGGLIATIDALADLFR